VYIYIHITKICLLHHEVKERCMITNTKLQDICIFQIVAVFVSLLFYCVNDTIIIKIDTNNYC